jgi:hypothetical protein
LYLASVGMTYTSGSITWTASGFQEPVVPDTGRTFSFLPQTLVTSMLSGVVGVVSEGPGKYSKSVRSSPPFFIAIQTGFEEEGLNLHQRISELLFAKYIGFF